MMPDSEYYPSLLRDYRRVKDVEFIDNIIELSPMFYLLGIFVHMIHKMTEELPYKEVEHFRGD